jgi:hypothetical protein
MARFRCNHDWVDDYGCEDGSKQHCVICGAHTTAAKLAGAKKAAATRRAAVDADGFTAKQRAKAAQLVACWLSLHGDPTRYEVKKHELTVTEYGNVSLFVVIGMVGDEGTMAQLLCRERRHVFIGRDGGLACYKTEKNAAGRYRVKRLRGRAAAMHYEH